MNPITEDCLAHHGILGQKWGVRRYQNEDGSLTPAGRKREYKNDNRKRRDFELQSYDSAHFSKAINKKADKLADKATLRTLKYGKDDPRSVRARTTTNATRSVADYHKVQNDKDVDDVIKYVAYMKEKYKDFKVADLNLKTMKTGEQYVSNIRVKMANANATYGTKRRRSGKNTYYVPSKTRYYYV